MKIRSDFVSNSSSSSFIITNKTNEDMSVLDFAKENPELLEDYNDLYSGEYTLKQLFKSAKDDSRVLKPGENEISFGDSDNTVTGCVYDYILRDGGSSRSFMWRFHESWR